MIDADLRLAGLAGEETEGDGADLHTVAVAWPRVLCEGLKCRMIGCWKW